MKTTYLLRNLLAIAAGTGFLTGCVSDNYHQGANTAAALNESSAMITRSNTLIDESLADLNDLVSNPYPDLRKQFKRFNSAVDGLDASSKDVASKAVDMQSQGAAYFAKWDKDSARIQNEDIRSRSEARRTEVAARFDRISQQYADTKTAFAPFMSDLRDVQKFLSTDLTAGGLAAIKATAAKATNDAIPVKDSLGRLSVEFKSLGLSMSPSADAR